MIRINLLPKHYSASPRRGRALLAYGLFLALTAGLLAAFKIFYLDVQLEEARKQAPLTAAAPIEKEKRPSVFSNAVLAELWELESGRRHQPLLLAEVARRLPYPQVWLLSYAHENRRLRLTAMALDSDFAQNFLDNLSQSPYLDKPTLSESNRVILNGHHLVSFTVEANSRFRNDSLFEFYEAEKGERK